MNKIIRTIIKIACIKGINYVPISIFLALSTNSGCDNISLVTFIKVNKISMGWFSFVFRAVGFMLCVKSSSYSSYSSKQNILKNMTCAKNGWA